MSLSASHSPHIIHVVHHDRVYELLAPLTHRQGEEKKASTVAPLSVQSVAKTNNQFNKYGVFVPAPTNKKGYFDE
jgi:hypothetical protein